MGIVTHSMATSRNHTQTFGTAHFAMNRMISFIKETDEIIRPLNDGAEYNRLTISDRVLDLVNNNTLAHGGDGLLDADTDVDGLINEGGADLSEKVRFMLDKTDSLNWKLTEEVPDYTTNDISDLTIPRVICENVTGFTTQILSDGVIRILLTTSYDTMDITLETRSRALFLTP
jgi:hypothetical protein